MSLRPPSGPGPAAAQPSWQPSDDDTDTDLRAVPTGVLPRLDLEPIPNVYQAFKHLLSQRRSDIAAVAANGGFHLRVGTMCSGTEAPVFALKLIRDISQLLTNNQMLVEFDHLFSVEIEPYKQAYISRNAPGSIIFRDVVDLTDPKASTAPTVLGDHCKIPDNIDLLVAGTSCVDFSNLNTQKKNSMELMRSGKTLVQEWNNSGQGDKNAILKPLRHDYFDDVRHWLNGITPGAIQEARASMGDSSSTFLSTVCYINIHRPKMVVLENVSGAPWSTMCDLFLYAAGYAARHALMDTKDYYIPQTRCRGYVVALDRRIFGSSAEKILLEWEAQVKGLKRSPSTPVQDWLLPSHDPMTMIARQDESEKVIANGMRPRKTENRWERSQLRHARTRRKLEIGNGRPLTAWGLGGIEQPYDRIDRLLIKSLHDRALDCMEIYYLRCLHPIQRGNSDTPKYASTVPKQYDIRFKSQIFDLSQNIDRSNGTQNYGIAGCITPRGLHFISEQGRLVTGFEALNLQGLPLRDLDLTGESQDELRDLAGNAMTTTVVGTALFSLLIAIHLHGNNDEKLPLSKITTHSHNVIPYRPLHQPPFVEDTEIWGSSPEPFYHVQRVIDISKRCRRYCYCNGGAKYSTDKLVYCLICGITRCTNCRGNPAHKFLPMSSIEAPVMNDTAPQEVMEHFPTVLTNVISSHVERILFGPGFEVPELHNPILNSLRSSTFYYTRVLISETVTICYFAKDENCSFHLQAVIEDRWITWYLFLDRWSPCGKSVTKKLKPMPDLSRPFGRVRILPQGPVFIPNKDAWEFWVFTETFFDIDILKPQCDSVEIRRIHLGNLPTPVHSDLQSLIGIYEHHSECDAAENSLHVRKEPSKRFLFKDPTRFGRVEEDCYVISDECRFLENHEFRDLCVKFLPTWTPQVTGTRATVSMKGYWAGAMEGATRAQAPVPHNLISYVKQAGSRFVPEGLELRPNDDCHGVQTVASISIDSNLLADAYMTLAKYERVGPECWAIVSRSDYSVLSDLLAPVNVNLNGLESQFHFSGTECCKKCCPSPPQLHWMEGSSDVPSKSSMQSRTNKTNTAQEPYHISTEMRIYREELQHSGEPLLVAINIKDSNKKKGWKQVTANYEVNIDMLLHRVLNHLPTTKANKEGVLRVNTTINMKREPLNIPNLRFDSFQTSLRHLLGSSSQNGSSPSQLFIDGYRLTKQQEVSLAWMLIKEDDPLPFTEREIEECRVDSLNLRVLAVAERDILCRGGILADDVGYGKTVITLALMAARQEFDRERSMQQRSGKADITLALPATLVLVPKHLVNQWRDEAAKFLGWKGADVLVIKSNRDLRGMLDNRVSEGQTPMPPRKRLRVAARSTTRREELRAAKLIIASTTIFDDEYYAWLGKYAGSLAAPHIIPNTNSTKDTSNPHILGAFQDWYEDAVTHARTHLSGFDPTIFNTSQLETIEKRRRCLQDSWKDVVADYYDVSTRIGLQNMQNTGNNETMRREYNDTARAEILVKQDFEDNNCVHVLEAFSFARVVYDEFSYENFSVAQFVKHAKAHAKWILSATPPTGNIKAICDIGELLNIHVARPAKLRPGLPLITEGPIALRPNLAEYQLSYGRVYTDQSVYDRAKQAHKFLEHFASANLLNEEDLGQIKVNEKVHCSHMSRGELARYLDAQQDLRNPDVDMQTTLKRRIPETDRVIDFPTGPRANTQKTYAGLALAFFASVDCTEGDDSDDTSKLLISRYKSLEAAQKKLNRVTNVAIWLVLRRYQEQLHKYNSSATNVVEDLADHIKSILEKNPKVFGGIEALEAMINSTFDNEQFAEYSKWIEALDINTKTSKSFSRDLFQFLGEKMAPDSCMTYFHLSEAQIDDLRDSEVFAFVRELSKQDHGPLTRPEAEELLRELVTERLPTKDLQHQQTTTRRSVRDRKQQVQPETRVDATDEGEGTTAQDKLPKYPRFQHRKQIRGGNYSETESELCDIILKVNEARDEVIARAKQAMTASNLFYCGSAYKCDACGQSGDDPHFLPECGHFICSSHLKDKLCGDIKSERYPNGSGCLSPIYKRSIPAAQISRCAIQASAKRKHRIEGKPLPKASSKSWDIVDTIKHILTEKKERVLVFYQLHTQRREICQLLDYYGIAFELGSGSRKPSSTARSVKGDGQGVRILQLNSEEAAGSNFQDANHVIFVSAPVFAKQEDFDRYVRQATGRAVRHGQRRDVDIHYFVTANTFEIDLLQIRKRCYIRRKAETDNEAYFVPMNTHANHDGSDSATHHDSSDSATSRDSSDSTPNHDGSDSTSNHDGSDTSANHYYSDTTPNHDGSDSVGSAELVADTLEKGS
ncbi:hypothetical protein F4777DRAFT_577238 [Nemania sp. FL0916]|nr:hypothetical protein F4777DRAFT_577238 [Nemania sp. FL0916]